MTWLSQQRGPYWGVTRIVVRGTNFTDVRKVIFGGNAGFDLQVLSSTRLVVFDPEHNYGTFHVRVITAAGMSQRTPANRFTFTHPTLTTPIMGGLTARQEQRISAGVRARHHNARIAPAARHWTAAMGATAVRRARSWLGLPYAWDGGDGAGPTTGVCEHNGGDMDCHVVGFDCSGLTLYAWAPYEDLIHFSGSQKGEAGRFHPSIGELMPGDLVFFSGDDPSGIGHVAIYTGHGLVIQAPQSGTVVMRTTLAHVIAESGVYRGATRPMSRGFRFPGPTIASVTAQVPSGGGYVTITGQRLGQATAVSVGSTMLYRFAAQGAHRLVVKLPAHSSGRVRLSVYTGWGVARRAIAYLPGPQSSTSSRHATGGLTARRAPARGTEPSTRAARTRFFEDRIGERWYEMGRAMRR